MATLDQKPSRLSVLPPVIPPTTRWNFMRNWWRRSEATSAIAEERLLQRIYANHPLRNSIPLKAYRVAVPLNGDQSTCINTLVIEPCTDQKEPFIFAGDHQGPIQTNDNSSLRNLVMCHGYGAGLGFFYRNYYALGQMPGWRIFSIDWLGMGRSSRPKWTISRKTNQSWDDIVHEVEDHFVESLEDWRKQVGLKQMTLMGHSMGGYFAVCYALKYPERVEKLILVSPAGIPDHKPSQPSTRPNSTPRETLDAEVSELSATMQAMAESAGDPVKQSEETSLPSTSTSSTSSASLESLTKPPPLAPDSTASLQTSPPRRIPSWAKYLWDKNITPMSIVRMSGPFGPGLVHRYTSRRFAHLDEDEGHDLYDYLYHITSGNGSGEYTLAAILEPGARARKPLYHRLANLEMPVLFVYGDSDWMDYKAAESAKKHMHVPVKVIRVSNGGHHMYLDNPDEFNDIMVEELKA